jgi:ketosteroid isomerase-like protein
MVWVVADKSKRGENMRKVGLLRVGVVALMLISGCAGFDRGPSDEELIRAVIEKWKAAAVAQDIDAQMTLLSESFQGSQGSKAETRGFMLQVKEMGYLEDTEVLLEEAEITIEGDAATAYPIGIETAMGTATVELRLTREAAGWAITGMNLVY